jgi:hypothetical protein
MMDTQKYAKLNEVDRCKFCLKYIMIPELVKESTCSYGARRFILVLTTPRLKCLHIHHLDIIDAKERRNIVLWLLML